MTSFNLALVLVGLFAGALRGGIDLRLSGSVLLAAQTEATALRTTATSLMIVAALALY